MSKPGDQRFAIIGAGNIGRILLDRLLASGVPIENLVTARGAQEKMEQFQKKLMGS